MFDVGTTFGGFLPPGCLGFPSTVTITLFCSGIELAPLSFFFSWKAKDLFIPRSIFIVKTKNYEKAYYLVVFFHSPFSSYFWMKMQVHWYYLMKCFPLASSLPQLAFLRLLDRVDQGEAEILEVNRSVIWKSNRL